MTSIRTLSHEEHDLVGGGNPEMQSDLYDYWPGGYPVGDLEDRFPGGEWVGNSFYPNGAPSMPQGWSH
ncbi:hypothetical protein [Alteriqipengyuania lutimaris]|uniref:Uncharacterized protein n=1 Tax=Alteriqipengyuania lutimaris TaxID=1538146 RepID=A0A395LMR1_9SPHN|nr:hypothetical protein [Alteriqipengyuania lutimaris]MBB3032653.1 hypothetical protein [Alteriqipengyuania lutimaris]RDS78232.1 hypothetical protein DL238_11865 [Alteriqipengyuania lutimaris]